jgi:molecular chaperone DnaK (HSP70)
LPKGSRIEVIYSYDDSGRVRVRAVDKTGGRAATTEIERGGGLRDTEVDAYTNLARQYLVE